MAKTFFALAMMAVAAEGTPAAAAGTDDQLTIELTSGKVVIQLLPETAPKHVARIKELAREKFYDGVPFHRVITGFMAQTGDPTGKGTGGSGQKIQAEFSKLPFERGTVGMARAQDPNSADSQFFICFAPSSFLNGKYTVVGRVVEGMELVDKIAVGEPPRNPDKMIHVTVGGAQG